MIEPYGGTLTDLVVADAARLADARRLAAAAVPVRLSSRSICDLELLATGAFSPLTTFMGEADYQSVMRTMRLASDVLYPIPVTLPLPDGLRVGHGDVLALQDATGELLAVMHVDEVFRRDVVAEPACVCGTTDIRHPLVAEMTTWPQRYVSGVLDVISLPRHEHFPELHQTPRQVRAALARTGAEHVVAFQTRNPMHRVHEELTKRAAQRVDGVLLIHPVVGRTRPGDVDACTRVLCYRELVSRYYDPTRTVLSLLPLAMRMAGPREAVWHAIIRRNHGATHFIVGRDHAGPGRDSTGRAFYGPSDAEALARSCERETGVAVVGFEELLYVPDEQRYMERSQLGSRRAVAISGTDVRERYLAGHVPLPEWLTRPEVAALLQGAQVAPSCQPSSLPR